MELDKLTGFRLKDALEYLEKMNVSKCIFETTKEPRKESVPITENFRILRIIKDEKGAVRILLCDEN